MFNEEIIKLIGDPLMLSLSVCLYQGILLIRYIESLNLSDIQKKRVKV